MCCIIIQKGSIHYTYYIVQSSAANRLRFIIIFSLKPMELALLFWWVKVDVPLEEQRERENLMFPQGCFQPSQNSQNLWLLNESHGCGYSTLLNNSDLYF